MMINDPVAQERDILLREKRDWEERVRMLRIETGRLQRVLHGET